MAKPESFPWFKFYPIDYLRATRHMTLEQRGAYMDAICIQMELGRALPNDTSWLAHQMHISKRKADAIVAELLALQKLKRTPEGLSNERCEQEIAARSHQRQVNTETAQKREANRRLAAASGEASPDVSRLARESFTAEPELSQLRANAENFEKPNEISAGSEISCAKESTTRTRVDTDKEYIPPTPCGGGEPFVLAGEPVKATKAKARLDEARGAIDDYNKAAKHLGFSVRTSVTDALVRLMARRLEDIGGRERFRQALQQIRFNDFLMGRVPPREGQKPFKLDIDRLLSTKSGMGDVLAKLLDNAPAAPGEPVGPNGERWGWWREEPKLKNLSAGYWRTRLDEVKPNGTWPWWLVGPPPGHEECLVHPAVLAERGLVDVYRGQITH